jgi:proteic killer suppression protein
MIRNFKDRATQRLYEGDREAACEEIAERAVRRLALLDSAEALEDLYGLPSNRVEELSGGERYGLRIDDRWRLCFRWEAERPCEVELAVGGGEEVER